jgi:hypothetical protein
MVLWQLFNLGFDQGNLFGGVASILLGTRLLRHNRFSSEVSLAVCFEGFAVLKRRVAAILALDRASLLKWVDQEPVVPELIGE